MDRRTFIAGTVAAVAALKLPNFASAGETVRGIHAASGNPEFFDISLVKEGGEPIKKTGRLKIPLSKARLPKCLAEQMLFHDRHLPAQGLIPTYDKDVRAVGYAFAPAQFIGESISIPWVEVTGRSEDSVAEKKDEMLVRLLEASACLWASQNASKGSLTNKVLAADEAISVHEFPQERQILVHPDNAAKILEAWRAACRKTARLDERLSFSRPRGPYSFDESHICFIGKRRIGSVQRGEGGEEYRRSLLLFSSSSCPKSVAYMVPQPDFFGVYLCKYFVVPGGWHPTRHFHSVAMAILNDYGVVEITL